jgi:hypothetical protein
VYVEDRKNGGKKVFFKILFAESQKITLGKEILASVFYVPRAFCLALGKEAFFAESFLFDSQHRTRL